jgi:hypothetical protein
VATGATGSHVGFVTDVDLKNSAFTLESGNASNIYTTRKISCFSFYTPPSNVLSALTGNGVPRLRFDTLTMPSTLQIPRHRFGGDKAKPPLVQPLSSSPAALLCFDIHHHTGVERPMSKERFPCVRVSAA